MARKVVLVSDLTGKEIDEKDGATVTIRYADARRGQVVLDVNASEVNDLAAKGRKQAKRGRRPKGVPLDDVRPILEVGTSIPTFPGPAPRKRSARRG